MAHVTTLSRLPKTSHTIVPQIPYNRPRHPNPPPQIRGLWGFSHQRYNHDRHRDHIRLILDKHQRLRKRHHPLREERHTIYPDYHPHYHYHPWQRNPRWGWTWSSCKPGFPESQSRPRPRQEVFDSWEDRAQWRMDRIKKEIEDDPYAALFGRRLEPFGLGFGVKLENGFTSLCRSLFGLDKMEKDVGGAAGRTRGGSQTRSTSGGEVLQASETERVQNQPSLHLKEAGFEFDPISGRMVSRRPEPLEAAEGRGEGSHVTDGQAAELKSKLEEPEISPRDKVETKPYDLSNPDIVDSSNQGDSTVSGTSRGSLGMYEATDTSHGQNSAFPPTREASDSKSELLEDSQETIRAETSQPADQIQQPVPPDNDDHGVPSSDGTIQSSQSFDAKNLDVPEKPVAEYHGPELDRVGFLSRRDNEALPSAASGTAQVRCAIDERDGNLDSLRASDIRAIYDSRKLSIESEIEAEAPNCRSETLPQYMGTEYIDHHSKSLADQNGDSSSSPREWPISTASSLSNEQALNESQAPVTMNQASTPEVYRIFAYDPSSSKVTEAETTSSLQTSSEHLHPTEVLTHLTNPAKFLPCLNQMHAEGYEIVSGGGDLLVFRKAPKTESSEATQSQHNDSKSSIKEHPEEEATLEPAHDGFYTGNMSEHHLSTDYAHPKSGPKSRVRKVLRRMLISGVATAGTCYALGVVSEYFRTGGEGGWGIDGFTEFESERLHMSDK